MKKVIRIVLALAISTFMAGMGSSPLYAMGIGIDSGGDSDRMTLSFDTGVVPDYTVRRTGTNTVAVTLSAQAWQGERKPELAGVRGGRIISSLRVSGNSLIIQTSTKAFGFINVPVAGKPQALIQFFRDPIGARWKPPSQRKAIPPKQAKPRPKVQRPSKPKAKPVAKKAVKPKPPVKAAASKTAPKKAIAPKKSIQKVAPPAKKGKPAAKNVVQEQKPVKATKPPAVVEEKAETQGRVKQIGGNVTEAELKPSTGDRKPFFSVPHTVRTSVAPPPGSDSGSGTHAMRFKATDKQAEEVKLAELGNPEEARAPVISLPGSKPLQGQGDAGVRGSVVPPPEAMPLSGVSLAGNSARGGVVKPPAPAHESNNEIEGKTEIATQPAELAQPSADGEHKAQVSSPPEPTASSAHSAEVSGTVAPPPSFNMPEDSPEPKDTLPQDIAPEEQREELAETGQEAQQPEQLTEETAPDGTDEAEASSEGQEGEKPLTPDEVREQLQNDAFEAQSLMVNGSLEAAKEAFERILPNPLLPDDLREEALYSLGDINMQLYSDDPADKFDEIAGSYTEALNYNPDSHKAPRALVNLGLINLKVGNLPEAKAYFSILQSKYPNDPVIPSISYYWGEYYFRKGEFRKAADQLQHLVQTYPENELVKDAAFLLAQSLERIGYDKQAFQIVDYIDKRWPDYYMARPEYLLLAGGIEMRLKKFALAKDHYFTYYNLNPDADSADIALGRVGDIYLLQGFKQAAREIYEKAAKDYPDKEGGLVSKMRLAEEGIYDDPTMVQMVSVFDRPFTMRPVSVYEEIVKKYPESPLAPVAQLKLAMWYAFHKKYADALGASQDFIDTFPESDLKPRARALGDKVFALAVPGLVEEGNHQRVVRYWENYDFIGKGDTKVDDNTRIMVATSYWKLGQSEKALEILQPYLGDKQIPGASEKAIDLAVGIHLDQYAWDSMNKLVAHADKNWQLQPKQLRQLKYARAMALQNMGEGKEALPLWAELAMTPEVDPAFRGYAMYYMAKDAMKRQDLKRVFTYAQEALTLLLQTDGDPEKVKDAVQMSIYATERSGRYEEALKWAREYDKYITPDNPEWAPTRFKLARIYKKAGAVGEWKKLLQDIIDKRPDSLQSSLAQAALDNYSVENQAREYTPSPQ